MADDNDTAKPGDDDAIIREAKKRFDRCRDWEALAREHFKNDVKFVNGDSYNKYQWPDLVFQGRQQANAPALTINKTRQHCLQIINDAKQNKPGVNIRPVGGGATFEAAQVFEGIVRHIEYISAAEQVYDHATTNMVQGGWGYWRVVTDYASDDTFDQEIYLRRVRDPLAVYLDPDINEFDGSDARYAFVFEDKPKQEFYNEYPDQKDSGLENAAFDNDSWLTKEHIRVAEYYRKSEKKDMLCVFTAPGQDGQPQQITAKKSEMPAEVYKLAKSMPDFREREVIDDEITWYLIAGDRIIDTKPWAGKYIPIVRVVAEETVIDGTLDRKGHVRNLTDPQRIYNYWSSAAVEQVALQNKAPYVGPVAAFEGLEQYWNKANQANFPYLPYNATDENGNPVQRPERQNPPTMAQAYIEGMQIAQQEMMMASGQYQAQMGENENAKSGRAIAERQRQGDNATYHFVDGLAVGIRYTGKILIDLIPKIYDTPRVIKIMAEDGEQSDVQVDPNSQQAYVEEQQQEEETARVIFNPNVGKYSVVADIGPAYATKRQEAFNAFTQILSQNANLTPIIGDLMFKNADFPGADEIAERLQRMVPPQAKGDQPPPEVMEMQQQLQNMQQILGKMSQALAEKEMQIHAKDSLRDIEAYRAETDRIGTMANAVPEVGIDALKAIIAQTLAEMMSQPQPNPPEAAEMGEQAPMGFPQ